MAEEEAGTESEEKPSGKGGLVKTLLIAVIAAALGAGGAYFALGAGADEGSEVAAEGDAAASDGEDAGAEDAPEPEASASSEDLLERMVELTPFVVNISDEGLSRYLKIKLALELAATDDLPMIEAQTARIQDAIIVLLSAKRLADLNGFEGKLLLKEELRDRANAVLGSKRVKAVLFTEFVVQ